MATQVGEPDAAREMAEARAKEWGVNSVWREMQCPLGFGEKARQGLQRPLTLFPEHEHRPERKAKLEGGWSRAAVDFEERWGDNSTEAPIPAAVWFATIRFLLTMGVLRWVPVLGACSSSGQGS